MARRLYFAATVRQQYRHTVTKRTPPRSPLEHAYSCLDRLSRQERQLKSALDTTQRGEPLSCTAARRVMMLASYVETGMRPDNIEVVLDAIAHVTVLLYGDASGTPLGDRPRSDQGADPLGQLLDAASARAAIEMDPDVDLVRLAALADLSVRAVRVDVTAKRTLVRSAVGRVTSESAARWLGKRGAMGFERPIYKTGAHGAH